MLYIFMNRSAFSNVVWAFGQAISIWADMRVETFRVKELFNDENIENIVYQKVGRLPHDNLRYKFLALNAFASMICE